MKQASIILLAIFIKIAICQTMLPSGVSVYGNAPVSGFNCYAVNATINTAININVSLKTDSAPVEVLVARDPNVCSREGKNSASFVVNTPIENNVYSLSFLSYADGAQYIAVFNMGSQGASFDIQVDTGMPVLVRAGATYNGFAPPTSVTALQYKFEVVTDSFTVSLNGESVTYTLQFHDYVTTFTVTEPTVHTITPCDLPQFSSAAGVWTLSIQSGDQSSNAPFTFQYYAADTVTQIETITIGGPLSTTLQPNTWSIFRANSPTGSPIAITVNDNSGGLYTLYTSDTCSPSYDEVNIPISQNLNKVVIVPKTAGYLLVSIFNKQPTESQVDIQVDNADPSINLKTPISGIADVDRMIYFTYDASDNLPFSINTVGSPLVFIKKAEFPTIDDYDNTYPGNSNIKINPCDSDIKIYRIGVVRKSESSGPFFAIYPAKDGTSKCTSTANNNEVPVENTSSASSSSSHSNVGLIVGLSIAAVIVLVIIVGTTFHYLKKRSFRKDDLTPAPKLAHALSLKTVA